MVLEQRSSHVKANNRLVRRWSKSLAKIAVKIYHLSLKFNIWEGYIWTVFYEHVHMCERVINFNNTKYNLIKIQARKL